MEKFIKFNEKIIFAGIAPYDANELSKCTKVKVSFGIKLATPKETVNYDYPHIKSVVLKTEELVEVEDSELIKLWPHRVRKNGYPDHMKTDKFLQRELSNRLYSLVGEKWKQTK